VRHRNIGRWTSNTCQVHDRRLNATDKDRIQRLEENQIKIIQRRTIIQENTRPTQLFFTDSGKDNFVKYIPLNRMLICCNNICNFDLLCDNINKSKIYTYKFQKLFLFLFFIYINILFYHVTLLI